MILGIGRSLLITITTFVIIHTSNDNFLERIHSNSESQVNYTNEGLVSVYCSSKKIAMIEEKIKEDNFNSRDFYLLFYLIDDPTCINEKKFRIHNALFKLIKIQPGNFLFAYRSCSEALKKKTLSILETPLIKNTKRVDTLFSITHLEIGGFEQEIEEITEALRNGLLSIEKAE